MGDTTGGAATSSDGGKGANFDCYIGSLISLTSKSDIRYEGILYTIDAENCNIALQNVRSYGTEGRKKEGPQIPPKDNVYEYIIFRGTDIKDLQVKSSPQAAYVDPAIVAQSQQPPKSQRMTTSPMAAPVGIPPPQQSPAGFAHPNHSPVIPHPPLGVPPPRDTPSHQSLLPPGFLSSSYPPGVGLGGLAQWGPRPPPVGNGPMPMYWPGNYYPPSSMQYMQSQQPPVPPPAVKTEVKPAEATPTSTYPIASSIAEVAPAVDKPREVIPPVIPQAREVLSRDVLPQPRDVLPREVLSEVLPREVLPPMTAVLTPIAKRVTTQEVSKDVIVNSDTQSVETTETTKLQVTDSVVQESSSSQLRSSNDHQVNTRPEKHEHPRPDNGRHNWRGNGRRGRGRGPAHRTQNFTEDFDFMAMNEKFNKDEVWGELGKTEPRNGEDEDLNEGSWQGAEDNSVRKPVYVKDDFFDTLSCDALDREGGNTERPRFSEQRKINTETFGDAFLRRGRGYRGYMGGRGGYRRGGRPHQAAGV